MLDVRLVEGVKVATKPAELRETVPDTFPPAEDKVNVVAGELIVAGFIAWLNVAVIRAVLGHTPTLPFGGVTEVTVGAGHGPEVVNVHTRLAAR